MRQKRAFTTNKTKFVNISDTDMVVTRNRIFLLLITVLMLVSTAPIAIPRVDATTNPPGFSDDTYTPIYLNPLNIREEMTLSPVFTPDNALEVHVAWIKNANSTIELQNQYIRAFDDPVDWSTDTNPLVRELEHAAGRGVQIRVQVREDSDNDFVAPYLDGIPNINARYMGTEISSDDDNWISSTHNKMLIIDSKVSLISSINYGENAFFNNREAGMVIRSSTVAAYYLEFFEEDWVDGESVSMPLQPLTTYPSQNQLSSDFESHTNIPKQNFTGMYNVSAFVNPDNADQIIFDYLSSAKKSVYVSMYTISRQDFVDALVKLKQDNPSIDIQVLISRRRVGSSENEDTHAAAEELVENLIPVYNSTDGLNFYHNKYWIIDQKHTFVYSGNWSPRSVTPQEQDNIYTSSFPNRDMGIAIHDAPDIANFFKSEVWDQDVAVGSAWDLPVGITQTSFMAADVVEGEVTLSASITGLNDPTVSYKFGTSTFTEVDLEGDSFSIIFDTTVIENGIRTFEVQAKTDSQTFSDDVTVNVVNIPASTNWRVLITEVHPNPDVDSDTKAEFFEITNSFPFDVYLEGWQVGDDDDGLHTFTRGDEIDAYSSLLIARDATGFQNGFGIAADIELDFSLTNNGDLVRLLDRNGNHIDIVAFGNVEAPDGSESIDMPDAGQSINRSPLHRDTDRATDFDIGAPTPGEDVPHVLLDETTTDELWWSPVILILGVVLVSLRRRRKK